MLSLITPNRQLVNVRDQFKERRLLIGYTQVSLSEKSGVPLGSIKRFEKSGEISLKSLLKLSVPLECIDDFTSVAKCSIENAQPVSIKTLQKAAAKPKRGRR